jgi:hypothetical protein
MSGPCQRRRAKRLGDQPVARAGIEQGIDAPPARSHPAPKALSRVAEPVQRSEDLAEHSLESAAAAVIGVDRGDDGCLVFREEARERPEVGDPLGVARLRRFEESPALRVEARLKFGGDGEVGEKNSGAPLLAIGERRRARSRASNGRRVFMMRGRGVTALTRSGNILH